MKPTKPTNPKKRIGKLDKQSANKAEHADAMSRPITLSFVIPCYNSEDYMDACVSSMLGAGEDTEIIIVDDGSTDKTAEKADRWAEHMPDTIRVIHQENSGHGGAVMAGIRAARGEYLKVVDSDDWLDRVALNLLMAKLRTFIAHKQGVDLVVCNYVYEHVLTGSRKVIRYLKALPMNKIMGWNSVRRFGVGQNILMHSAVYRTQVLRDSGMEMPKHTFYVDNIFVYVPLPYVKKLYYLPVNLYHYFIGREDQSVNEKVMLGRLDQQMRVTKMMAEAYALPDEVRNPHLARYMEGFLALIVTASSIFAVLRGDREALRMRDEMWEAIEAKSPKMAAMLRHNPLVWGANVKNPAARSVQVKLYRIAQRLYRFN
ncbi:glycosyltransferase, group 2 family protein [Mobiluncus mulieris 28-1]|uniref:Glycosyltransferase family 2 protein n=1 Tax=Mobiluncus mulieris TaxID=2052 RepID=A0A7Y0Y5Q7_9ACTO|nr:glycosyltransferase, group 2 family protein [Mobiluncus mulieris ATCC 35243]EEZ90628.1 glycosyltransferase, group 2 family protein [Mobiluncus mulieris 28-1]MCU9996163.1 glycosyltransferase family 2 protein [Mobiluncus mulieris]MCV0002402.1 glycosyltransferase family 2 protein [Mobiluncus mulieris]NMW74252.1 glycosyltransferase family 2 protein [Mobiluncus mulieris]